MANLTDEEFYDRIGFLFWSASDSWIEVDNKLEEELGRWSKAEELQERLPLAWKELHDLDREHYIKQAQRFLSRLWTFFQGEIGHDAAGGLAGFCARQAGDMETLRQFGVAEEDLPAGPV